jgi:hypothetical protein
MASCICAVLLDPPRSIQAMGWDFLPSADANHVVLPLG